MPCASRSRILGFVAVSAVAVQGTTASVLSHGVLRTRHSHRGSGVDDFCTEITIRVRTGASSHVAWKTEPKVQHLALRQHVLLIQVHCCIVLQSRANADFGVYGPHSSTSKTFCIPPGTYTFVPAKSSISAAVTSVSRPPIPNTWKYSIESQGLQLIPWTVVGAPLARHMKFNVSE